MSPGLEAVSGSWLKHNSRGYNRYLSGCVLPLLPVRMSARTHAHTQVRNFAERRCAETVLRTGQNWVRSIVLPSLLAREEKQLQLSRQEMTPAVGAPLRWEL